MKMLHTNHIYEQIKVIALSLSVTNIRRWLIIVVTALVLLLGFIRANKAFADSIPDYSATSPVLIALSDLGPKKLVCRITVKGRIQVGFLAMGKKKSARNFASLRRLAKSLKRSSKRRKRYLSLIKSGNSACLKHFQDEENQGRATPTPSGGTPRGNDETVPDPSPSPIPSATPCNPTNDPNCPAQSICGDGIISAEEDCDCGADGSCTADELQQNTCITIGFDSGELGCHLSQHSIGCQFDTSQCFFYSSQIIYADNSLSNNCLDSYSPSDPEGSRCKVDTTTGISAYRFLQSAADAATPGTTVLVRENANSYQITNQEQNALRIVNSGLPNQPIIFKNFPSEHPHIRGTHQPGVAGSINQDLVLIEADYIHIIGIEISHAAGNAYERGSGLSLQGSHNLIESVYAHHNNAANIRLKNASYNILRENEGHNVCTAGSFELLPTSQYNLFENNLSYSNGYLDDGVTNCNPFDNSPADGFGLSHGNCRTAGTENCGHNEYRGNVTFHNNEDGFDNFGSHNLFIKNIVFDNVAVGFKMLQGGEETPYVWYVQNIVMESANGFQSSSTVGGGIINNLALRNRNRGFLAAKGEVHNNISLGNSRDLGESLCLAPNCSNNWWASQSITGNYSGDPELLDQAATISPLSNPDWMVWGTQQRLSYIKDFFESHFSLSSTSSANTLAIPIAIVNPRTSEIEMVPSQAPLALGPFPSNNSQVPAL